MRHQWDSHYRNRKKKTKHKIQRKSNTNSEKFDRVLPDGHQNSRKKEEKKKYVIENSFTILHVPVLVILFHFDE